MSFKRSLKRDLNMLPELLVHCGFSAENPLAWQQAVLFPASELCVSQQLLMHELYS